MSLPEFYRRRKTCKVNLVETIFQRSVKQEKREKGRS